MTRCLYSWQAPYVEPPPSKKVVHLEQRCSLDRGHAGPHRSLSNVIAPLDARGIADHVWGRVQKHQAEHNVGVGKLCVRIHPLDLDLLRREFRLRRSHDPFTPEGLAFGGLSPLLFGVRLEEDETVERGEPQVVRSAE